MCNASRPLLVCLFTLTAALACGAAGCTSAVTQLQRGKTLDRLQFEVNVGMSAPISGKAVQSVIDAEDALKQRIDSATSQGTALTDDDARALTEVAAAVLLFTPIPSTELSVRGGIGWGVDVGLRLTGPRTQLDVKWQALDARQHGLDLGLSLAVASHSSPAPSLWESAFSVAESLKIAEYQRRDVTLSLIGSRDFNPMFSAWFALAYSRSSIVIGSALQGAAAKANIDASALEIDEVMHQYGGQLGCRVGYKYVFLLIELSVMQADFSPTILGEKLNLSGPIITPSIALQATF